MQSKTHALDTLEDVVQTKSEARLDIEEMPIARRFSHYVFGYREAKTAHVSYALTLEAFLSAGSNSSGSGRFV